MLRRLDRGYAASVEPGLDTLSLLRLYYLDRTGGEGNVTACLKALQPGENGSPTETVWKIRKASTLGSHESTKRREKRPYRRFALPK